VSKIVPRETTLQSLLDDSFSEVTHKRSRREKKLINKEKLHEEKVTKKLCGGVSSDQ
jgi:hypothetical protein